jgi:hypothetical protein
MSKRSQKNEIPQSILAKREVATNTKKRRGAVGERCFRSGFLRDFRYFIGSRNGYHCTTLRCGIESYSDI